MRKALVIYQSKKGHTRKYGEEIGQFLKEKGMESIVVSVDQFKTEQLKDVSHLFMGCWTSGLFLLLQHPDKPWIKAVENITIPAGVKVGLFTTYVLATGSMFKAMKKSIHSSSGDAMPEWKSKNSRLSESDKESIIRFINH